MSAPEWDDGAAQQEAEATQVPAEAVVGQPERVEAPPPALQGIELRIIPDEVEVELRPEPVSRGTHRPDTLWHRVGERPAALVTLTSTDTRPRVIRLSVRGPDARWRAGWARWILVVRRPPETLGGDAAAAQDVLSSDETVLNLLVLPGEKRAATLEFRTTLDREAYPGNHPFEVVATDADNGQSDTAAAMLRLRHPFGWLLEFLPAIYRELPEDAEGLDGYADPAFFQRYLLGFQDAVRPLRQTLDDLYQYFGATTTPPDFLPWLATWVGMILDENWPELKRRRLIREAVELYRLRGSRLGISRYLEIYTGVKPQINDRPFRGMRLGPQTLLGKDTVLGDVPPHTFVVTLAVPSGQSVNEQIVRDIIDAEKPAHTAYRLRIVEREAAEVERS